MSIDVWTKVHWNKEACDLSPDPVSGAAITRLTGSMLATNNNYLAAGCSINGRRIFATRFLDPLVSPINALLAIDLDTKWTAVLDPALANAHVLPVPFTGVCYYVNREAELCRASLETFEKEVVMTMRGMPPTDAVLRVVTPDQRYMFYVTPVTIAAGQSLAIVRLDLQKKSWEMIYESPGLTGVIYVGADNALLVGRRTLADGSTPPLGAWKNTAGIRGDHQLFDLDGRQIRPLGPAPGYSYFDARTGKVVCNCYYDATRWAQKPERPRGNMVVFDSPDCQNGRVIEAPGHLFHHIAGSRCGRYVASEALRAGTGPFGPTDIVVANWHTGKVRVLVDNCGALGGGGGNVMRQPTPYLTSDNSHVVYNADPDGVPNVYSAQLPDGFLASLD